MKRARLAFGVVALSLVCATAAAQTAPVAPANFTHAAVAQQSVLRVVCPEGNMQGSAFLHKSGLILTADHIVLACGSVDLIDSTGRSFKGVKIGEDSTRDIAAIRPAQRIDKPSFEIAGGEKPALGEMVAMWGFPGGYNGQTPLLAIGYVAGEDRCLGHTRTVINAAVNHGNSGGPVLNSRTGEVIGIADSKIVPIPDGVMNELAALKAQQSGVIYGQNDKGQLITEAQIVADIEHELFNQVQLVIGCATNASDIRDFLKNQGVDP